MSPEQRQRVAAAVPRDAYRELFERSADAILIIEGDTFVDCNDAAVEMLRYANKAEVLQTHPSELSPSRQPDGRESYEKANECMAIAFEHGSHRFEWDHVRADGEVFPVEVLLTAVRETGRGTLHVVWRDITERKLLEEQLRQALKMEAIGKLTGGIAHDFNNLLVSVIGHADLLEEVVRQQPAARDHVRQIQLAGARAADLVRQLLAFGRKQQLLPVALDLNELTSDVRNLIQRLVGEGVDLVLAPAESPVTIKADRSQIEQVLLNLAANARDAMPEGGRLTIETSHTSIEERRPSRELPAGSYAVLSVADTGTGMDTATAERAFDPFFTTKKAGEGSGLGLATVYGIVKQSQGAISLQSAPGAGTRVEILLPLTDEPVVKRTPRPRRPRTGSGGGEMVLVVEDEEAVSRLVTRALVARGYQVVCCSDGRQGVDAFQRHHAEIAMVITDVIMPNLSGPRMVLELEALGFSPRVLFMSGYTNEGLSPLELDRHMNVLDKPFNVGELIARVREVLEAR